MYIHFEFSDHSNPYIFYGSPLECLKQVFSWRKKYHIRELEKTNNGIFYIAINNHSHKNSFSSIKEIIRNQAIEWQNDFANCDYSYSELVEIQNYFEKQGKRYGLLREFRENGII